MTGNTCLRSGRHFEWSGNLIEIFRSIPSCKIGLCITYAVETGATLPFDYTFDLLSDGRYTLRDELAPIDTSDFRAFVDDYCRYRNLHLTSQLDLSIRHGEGVTTHTELVKITYHPPVPQTPPSPFKFPLPLPEGLVECNHNRESIEALARRARDDWEW
jgi:hypothetical protein